MLLCAASLAPPVCAQTAPPPMTVLRYDESYRYLDDPANRSGAWWESLKSIRLGEEDSAWRLDAGAEVWTRYEGFTNPDWGEGSDEAYLWVRTLPYLSLSPNEHLRFFGQMIFADSIDRDPAPTPIDENEADLLQGFAELNLPVLGYGTLSARVGRQLLVFGSGRLVDTRYGVNVPRPFDAALMELDHEPWKFTAFYSRPVETRIESFDDQTSDAQFFGAYATLDLDAAFALPKRMDAGLDLYYLGLDEDEARFGGDVALQLRHTVGARFFGESQGFDWNLEAFFQGGEFGDRDIRAWSLASDVGHTFASGPRIGLKANYISGDDDPNDGDLGTFDPLFPKGKYFGELTVVGPQNIFNVHPNFEVPISDELSVGANAVLYWLAETSDALYDLGGNVSRASAGTGDRFIGTQWDVWIGWAANRHFDLVLSYSQFHAGGFIRATWSNETIRLLAIEARFRF